MDFTLELVLIPVSDVDRAKTFYTERAGFELDVDQHPSDEFRVVQMTPPGSACSDHHRDRNHGRGAGLRPGHAPDRLRHRGRPGRARRTRGRRQRDPPSRVGWWVPGPDPERRDYGSFGDFGDPDGNTWVLQEVRRGEAGA